MSQTHTQNNRIPLTQANHALRQGKYAQAITDYARFMVEKPGLAKTIAANLTLARKKYRASRVGIETPHVGVCGWDLSHNGAGRAYTLATIYQTFTQVDIIGSVFPDFGRELWEPLRDTPIAKHRFLVEDESKFLEQAVHLVAAHPYDIVHLSKPRAPNLIFGMLYKLLWDAQVLIDIDDEELTFVGAATPIRLDDLLQQRHPWPTLRDLAGKDWTRIAVGLATAFDGVTVSNPALQQRYGGELIRDARDERLDQPTPERNPQDPVKSTDQVLDAPATAARLQQAVAQATPRPLRAAFASLAPALGAEWLEALLSLPSFGKNSRLLGDDREVGVEVEGNIDVWQAKLNVRPQKQESAQVKDPVPFDAFGPICHNPLISILIVSYNSSRNLVTLLPTLQTQSYQNFEIILLENGDEPTEELCREYFNDVTYLKRDNIGFAAGNNACYESARGELIFLINPDTKLHPDCLQELLDFLRLDGHAAVVAPKIFFFEKFVRLQISTGQSFSFQLDPLLDALTYKKYFVRAGLEQAGTIFSDDEHSVIIDAPHPSVGTQIRLLLKSKTSFKQVRLTIGYCEENHIVLGQSMEFELPLHFTQQTYGSAQYLINNAGSGVKPDGIPYDRGFGEYEIGHYLSKTYLSAFCGCAALIRRVAILNRKIFIDELFAYFEDSELSLWLQQQGHRILYCPTAYVYHRHSESTQEHSPNWTTLVGRSRIIYQQLTQKEGSLKQLPPIPYHPSASAPLVNALKSLDHNLFAPNQSFERIIKRPVVTVGIYNSYFSSMGGGEKHTLEVAARLSEEFDVYLISESNFDIERLASYFNIELSRCKKIIQPNISEYLTTKFDVFINATFCSKLISRASLSYYILYFPQREVSAEFIASYIFLHISNFTATWANQFWGCHRFRYVVPVLGYSERAARHSKVKSLLSVGRITSSGHCKNHHLIIEAFRGAVDLGLLSSDWQLVIVGSCDFSRTDGTEYYRLLAEMSEGYNIRIEANASYEQLCDFYDRAYAYIHATGLNVPEDSPEKHEHFGITPFEAMLWGCIPIVYHLGGPADQVRNLDIARLFANQSELTECILTVATGFSGDENRNGIKDYALKQVNYNDAIMQQLISEIAGNR